MFPFLKITKSSFLIAKGKDSPIKAGQRVVSYSFGKGARGDFKVDVYSL
jgi:hypothetical protein